MYLIKETNQVKYLNYAVKTVCLPRTAIDGPESVLDLNKLVWHEETQEVFLVTALKICNVRGIPFYELTPLTSELIESEFSSGDLTAWISLNEENKHQIDVSNLRKEFQIIEDAEEFVWHGVRLNMAWASLGAASTYINDQESLIKGPYTLWRHIVQSIAAVELVEKSKLWKRSISRLKELLVLKKEMVSLKMSYDGYDVAGLKNTASIKDFE